MFGGSSCSFSFGTKIRTLEPVVAEKDRSHFFVGTSTLNQPNQIYLVEVDDKGNSIITHQVCNHPGEVLCLVPSPHERELLVTCGKQQGQRAEASLWKLPDTSNLEEEKCAATNLKQLSVFPAQKLPVSEFAWDATNTTSTLASSHETLLRTWQLNEGSVEAQEKLELDVSMMGDTTKKGASALVWDPHHALQLTFALGRNVHTWDLRAKQERISVEDAHPTATLSLDFNPNKPHTLASGGDDGKLKFWDLRYAQKPLLVMNAHSHWVWSTKYHPQHDQLVLSGGSDSTLALWRVSSISSSPLVELDERDLMDETADGAAVADVLIRRVEEHEDAVYAARWTAGGDAWMFVSVSYDGRLAVNHVPSTEKYKILL
ncbi:WD repeat protein TSSC1, WD repeat superfamily [Plasmopara halstedii]|uniref:WD repeat protein TSSC1, WD repeat superfamily n=1 Tax=Plasmopara halstedii TaxID=4781 RepID=A0A0P1B335_PLAHL|nr:WD repeat protein TSSC1, WD repeat superfamily [Plasmopara halstedii]CEG48053.1 WD repeat protein TSSC1, WD repeat superfamily [Plasmopara halstedii]|eukprot:XP_024584422.1 WD repeat protein TSSC1, WD repeat superfamily [Plasmopara halstedii]